MIEPAQLLSFVLAGWLLNLTPGPDVLYIVGQSLRGGRRAGLAAVAGVTAGCFVHVALAALGLGLLLATSAWLFDLLKWVGAALPAVARRAPVARTGRRRGSGRKRRVRHCAAAIAAGVRRRFPDLTSVLNPKVVLFFLAFLPQFIAPEVPDKALAFAALGALFMVNAIPVNAGYALLAERARRSGLVRRGRHWLDRLAGVMFIGFGVRLALSARSSA